MSVSVAAIACATATHCAAFSSLGAVIASVKANVNACSGLKELLVDMLVLTHLNHNQTPCKIPIGNMIAPATKNPHSPSEKHVKM